MKPFLVLNRFNFNNAYFSLSTPRNNNSMKFFIFILLSFVSLSGYSQITISPRNVYFSAPSSGDQEKKVNVSNYSADKQDTLLKWTIIENTLPANWGIAFCDPNDCIVSIPVGTNNTFAIDSGQTKEMKFGLLFNNISGSGKVTTTISSVKNPSIIDTIFYVASTWNTSITSLSNHVVAGVYPNPFKDHVNVQILHSKPVRFEVFNLMGEMVYSSLISEEQSIVSLTDIASGIYMVQLVNSDEILLKKRLVKIE